MMIEIGIIAVTSLARIQDLSNDLIEVLVFRSKSPVRDYEKRDDRDQRKHDRGYVLDHIGYG